MLQISNGKPDHLKLGQIKKNGCHFVKKKHLKPKLFNFKCLGPLLCPHLLKYGPFEICSSKCPDFEWSDFRSPLYSCASAIQKASKYQVQWGSEQRKHMNSVNCSIRKTTLIITQKIEGKCRNRLFVFDLQFATEYNNITMGLFHLNILSKVYTLRTDLLYSVLVCFLQNFTIVHRLIFLGYH